MRAAAVKTRSARPLAHVSITARVSVNLQDPAKRQQVLWVGWLVAETSAGGMKNNQGNHPVIKGVESTC